MGICIISRFAFAGRFTGGGVPVTLSALHYPPMKRRGMDLEGFSRGLTNSPLDCWFRRISGLRAAATRRLASETRLRAQCGASPCSNPLQVSIQTKSPAGIRRDFLFVWTWRDSNP